MERVFGDFPYVLRTPLPDLAPERDRVRPLVMAEYRAWRPQPDRHSFRIASRDPFFAGLHDRFRQTCEAAFEPFTLHPQSNASCFAYVQNNSRGASVWHDHLATSTINGVYYLSVPDATGEIWFMFRETLLRTAPQEGWLYLFPRWLLHRPVGQASPFFRISLNVELITHQCPIARDGQDRW